MVKNDKRNMRLALKAARQGTHRPSSEPVAGVVVVTGETVAGSGAAGGAEAHSGIWGTGAAQAHSAISAALDAAGLLAPGAVVYSTVWPGCDAADPDEDLARLIASRPARVVIGTIGEPFPARDGAPSS